MKKIICIIALVLCVLLGALTNCDNKCKVKVEKFVTNDSMCVFTFNCDSLYIDNIGKTPKRISYYLEDSLNGGNGEIIYFASKEETTDTIYIRISPDILGNHWNYFITINGEKFCVNKIN